MSVSLTHATGNKFSESVKKATLHFSFGGKWPLTGYTTVLDTGSTRFT